MPREESTSSGGNEEEKNGEGQEGSGKGWEPGKGLETSEEKDLQRGVISEEHAGHRGDVVAGIPLSFLGQRAGEGVTSAPVGTPDNGQFWVVSFSFLSFIFTVCFW